MIRNRAQVIQGIIDNPVIASDLPIAIREKAELEASGKWAELTGVHPSARVADVITPRVDAPSAQVTERSQPPIIAPTKPTAAENIAQCEAAIAAHQQSNPGASYTDAFLAVAKARPDLVTDTDGSAAAVSPDEMYTRQRIAIRMWQESHPHVSAFEARVACAERYRDLFTASERTELTDKLIADQQAANPNSTYEQAFFACAKANPDLFQD